MEENRSDIPWNSQKWAENAPFLGKWLWVLFWLVIPQALASLLVSDLFSPQSVPYFLGQLLQVAYLVCYGLVLLRLTSYVDRYRTAGICFLVNAAINILLIFFPSPEVGSGLALLLSAASVTGGIFMMVGEYQEYMGYSELLEDVEVELSDKWRKLWKWYIGCFLAVMGSIVVLLISPLLGALVALAGALGLIGVLVVKLVYLYRTTMIFRCWETEEPLQIEPGRTGDPWDSPDQPQ